jgi:hypothetical protein
MRSSHWITQFRPLYAHVSNEEMKRCREEVVLSTGVAEVVSVVLLVAVLGAAVVRP